MAFNWRRFLGLGEESQDREGRSHGSQEPPPTSTGRVYKPGEWIGGEYRVLDVFQGGMGSVYVVSHDELSYPIVLKTLQETNDPNSIRAFRREAETWVNVGFHQNVVKAHYFRFIDGLPFVAAEYIAPDPNGHNSLSDYVGIEVNESILLRWCAQFCNGMTHAQSHGVIAHRDVKPANLMLDSLGTLKIADFGLARSISLPSGTIEEQSEQATIAGTLPYMAPEQLHSPDQLDQRVDIYAIGVVLYQLLSGAFPFEVTSQERIVQGILRGIPSPLSSQLWPICKRSNTP